LTALAQAKMKRSAKIPLILFPVLIFCMSAFFALIHHFYHLALAGTLWYYTAIIAVAVIFGELLLIAFQK
jgi:hypothetical protein